MLTPTTAELLNAIEVLKKLGERINEHSAVLPKNSAALEKLWFTRLPDSSSSAFRQVLFGIG